MGGGTQAAANDSRPGGGLGAPIDAPDPLHPYRAYILGAFALVLVMGGAYIVSRSNRPHPATVPAGAAAKARTEAAEAAAAFADFVEPQCACPRPQRAAAGSDEGGIIPARVDRQQEKMTPEEYLRPKLPWMRPSSARCHGARARKATRSSMATSY